MTTTIPITETTKQRLDALRSKEKKKSYDQIIRRLLKTESQLKNMFGFTRENPLNFGKKDEMDFDEA